METTLVQSNITETTSVPQQTYYPITPSINGKTFAKLMLMLDKCGSNHVFFHIKRSEAGITFMNSSHIVLHEIIFHLIQNQNSEEIIFDLAVEKYKKELPLLLNDDMSWNFNSSTTPNRPSALFITQPSLNTTITFTLDPNIEEEEEYHVDSLRDMLGNMVARTINVADLLNPTIKVTLSEVLVCLWYANDGLHAKTTTNDKDLETIIPTLATDTQDTREIHFAAKFIRDLLPVFGTIPKKYQKHTLISVYLQREMPLCLDFQGSDFSLLSFQAPRAEEEEDTSDFEE